MEPDHADPKNNPRESNVEVVVEDNGGNGNGSSVGNVENQRESEDGSSVGNVENGKLKSLVWLHFTRKKEGEDVSTQYAECKYCNARLRAPPSYGTTHLKNHYDKTCKKRPRKTDIRQSVLAMNKKASSQELTTHVFNQDESRHLLASMIILHDYPLSIVDHIGFQRYSASLQPCFNMKSRNTLSDILKIYDTQKKKYYKLLEKLNCRIAITTDMWTSDNAKKGYMAITAHFIDDSWTLQNCILRFAYVPASHTAEVLSDILVESFMDWNIDRKISSITVDNCSTNDAMLTQILDKLPRKDLPLNGEVLHMRCCAHILNLIVKDGLEIINDAIERIRDSVMYWTASPGRLEKFEEATRQLHVGCSKRLSLDCKTRWNSTYLMLETAIKYRDVFPRLKCREKNYKSLPTDDDWKNAIEFCGKLKLFYQVTEMFSGTLYPTSNFYFPKICELKLRLDEWVMSTNLVVRSMAMRMLEKYKKYWDGCHIIMGVAAVLDPRYKMKLVEFYFPLICGEGSQSKINEVRDNCYRLLVEYHSSVGSSSNMGNTSPTPIFGSFEDDTLDMFDQFVSSSNSSASSSINGVKYPNLQKMARDILAIPVSTVASESAFSTSGRIVGPHRNRLHPTTLEALMCCRRWLWIDEKKGTSSAVSVSATCPTMFDEEEDVEECVPEV